MTPALSLRLPHPLPCPPPRPARCERLLIRRLPYHDCYRFVARLDAARVRRDDRRALSDWVRRGGAA